MKVAIYGTGGVGGYFGGRLAQAGIDVHLIARGTHLEALRTRGLQVDSPLGDFYVELPATDNPTEVCPCDVVLFSVKAFDTGSAAARLDPLIKGSTAVISFQNGVDNEAKIADVVGRDHVLGGVAYILSKILVPGVIAHTGGPARIVFGELDGSRSSRAERFLEVCQGAGIDADLSDDITKVLWMKFAFICAAAGMTAAVRLPIGEVRSVDASWETFKKAVAEVSAVAKAQGVLLPADTVENHAKFAEGLEPDGFSSLYDYLVSGRRMEVEALHGTVVSLARKRGIPVPVCETLYSILKPWATRNERSEGVGVEQ